MSDNPDGTQKSRRTEKNRNAPNKPVSSASSASDDTLVLPDVRLPTTTSPLTSSCIPPGTVGESSPAPLTTNAPTISSLRNLSTPWMHGIQADINPISLPSFKIFNPLSVRLSDLGLDVHANPLLPAGQVNIIHPAVRPPPNQEGNGSDEAGMHFVLGGNLQLSRNDQGDQIRRNAQAAVNTQSLMHSQVVSQNQMLMQQQLMSQQQAQIISQQQQAQILSQQQQAQIMSQQQAQLMMQQQQKVAQGQLLLAQTISQTQQQQILQSQLLLQTQIAKTSTQTTNDGQRTSPQPPAPHEHMKNDVQINSVVPSPESVSNISAGQSERGSGNIKRTVNPGQIIPSPTTPSVSGSKTAGNIISSSQQNDSDTRHSEQHSRVELRTEMIGQGRQEPDMEDSPCIRCGPDDSNSTSKQGMVSSERESRKSDPCSDSNRIESDACDTGKSPSSGCLNVTISQGSQDGKLTAESPKHSRSHGSQDRNQSAQSPSSKQELSDPEIDIYIQELMKYLMTGDVPPLYKPRNMAQEAIVNVAFN